MYLRKLVLLITLICFISTAFSRESKYRIDDIPATLRENAKIVVREYSREIEIISNSKTNEKFNLVISVLNENGIDDSKLIKFYDSFSSIRKIRCRVYNALGDLVNTIEKDEVRDYSAIPNFSLYADSRVKYVDPDYATIPFTVEYSWDENNNGVINYDDWMPAWDFNIAIEHSKLTVISSDDFKFKENGDWFSFNSDSSGKAHSWEWTLDNFNAIEKEDFALPMKMILPVIFLAPINFEVDKIQGSNATWESLGVWVNELNTMNNDFDDNVKNEILKLVEGEKDNIGKIKLLYRYLQEKTRYVNVTIGIGGWQPNSPQMVHDVSYGDCKALSFYMKKILETVDVPSYYTLINSGKNAMDLILDFPSSQFNHAVLCVPNEGDTIWLECTNQHAPFDYVSSFIDNRKALIISEEGGKIVSTGKSVENYHRKHTSCNISISENLIADIKATTSCSGIFYDDAYRLLHSEAEEVERIIRNDLKISSVDLLNFEVSETYQENTIAIKKIELMKKPALDELQNRYILPLNFLQDRIDLPTYKQHRYSDILVRRPILVSDSVSINIPENLQIDFTPENVSINTEFGQYILAITTMGQKIIFSQQFSLNEGIYASEKYGEFMEYFESVHEHDNPKCILRKKNE